MTEATLTTVEDGWVLTNAVPSTLRFTGSGTCLAEINLETGEVKLSDKWSESAKVFWESFGVHGKSLYQRIDELEAKLKRAEEVIAKKDEALKTICEFCGCSVKERESGHLVDCLAPFYEEALAIKIGDVD